MRQLKASELQEYDVILLTPNRKLVVTTDVERIGPMATFAVRTRTPDDKGWEPDAGVCLPAEFLIDVEHAWRDIQVPCLLCRNTYPHHMDIAVASDARGICGPCNRQTTAKVLREKAT